MAHRIEKLNDVHRVSFENQTNAKIMLTSDIHFDSKHFDRALFNDHMQLARNENMLIIINGDLFDAMQGRNDPRRSHGGINDELTKGAYFDNLVQSGVNLLEPYKDLVIGIGQGNHEESVLKHYGTDLTARIVEGLNGAGGDCVNLGYEGYILFSLLWKQTSKSALHTFKMYYHHGAGGSAPVTKNAIKANRRAVPRSDADIIHTGHTHITDYTPIKKIRVTKQGYVKEFIQGHISTAGYHKHGTWETMKGFAPETRGCAVVEFFKQKRTQGKARAAYSVSFLLG